MKQVKDRWDFRVAEGVDSLVRRAAETTDRSLTEFVVDAARLEAERVLADRTQFSLSPRQWASFKALLDRPPRENAGLKRLFARSSVLSAK
ncbi:MAG: DUF1778 domain-containing protein [Chloroflexi bacterium]|nr:DUF1778 domain-containing protein [Chloroflexota bacterium]